ncbi:histidine acid phosphatase [Thozetella sp. PMI_491]|nr:histidine acid phosphatase [Thozetella sp. PMI_491]
MWSDRRSTLLLAFVSATGGALAQDVDLSWHAPSQSQINNLTQVLSGTGVYGFIYNSSTTPDAVYGTYNWCNMPHARAREYKKPASEYELKYVELIHRHHKRTPYQSNTFPVESYRWDCDDQGLYYYGQPFNSANKAASSYWKGYISPINPFVPSGFVGSCQFPQITATGLDDSWQHGADLYALYHDLLGFLPGRGDDWRSKVTYRVTNNVITSQVAGMVINGMWGSASDVPLIIEATGVDSLEPQYSCSSASNAFNTIKSSSNPAWAQHLSSATSLYATLDDISGVSPTDSGFHASFDHYYDNLSARQCHGKPLPCKLVNGVNSTTCVTQDIADEVYRFGNWEYSQIYRDAPASLAASAGSFGVWIAELAAHLRAVIDGSGSTLYYHNIAHDGSVSRLLSILQIDTMVWPGMGSEVVFELYKKSASASSTTLATATKTSATDSTAPVSASGYYVRVLFGGQVLKSSNPSLGTMDMLPVETLLAYFDGLAGKNASLVTSKCNS